MKGPLGLVLRDIIAFCITPDMGADYNLTINGDQDDAVFFPSLFCQKTEAKSRRIRTYGFICALELGKMLGI
jgi:hypothetical protein